MHLDLDLEKQPTRIQWLLGNVCNYKCWYCPEHLRNGTTPGVAAQDLNRAVAYLARLIREQGREPSIEFQGGEPTFNEGLGMALAAIGSNQPRNKLTTNGSADLEWWEQNYFYFTDVEISYHPRYASFEHVAAVAQFLLDLEEPPSLTIKVHATNNDREWQMAYTAWERFQQLGLPAEIKLLYSNFTRGRQRMPYTTIQMQQYAMSRGEAPEPTVYQKTDNTGLLPVSRNVHPVDEIKQEIEQQKDQQVPTQTLCSSGIEQLIVWHTGDVYRGWCKAGGSLGNVFQETVDLPTEPTVCPFEICRNGFDRMNTREQVPI